MPNLKTVNNKLHMDRTEKVISCIAVIIVHPPPIGTQNTKFLKLLDERVLSIINYYTCVYYNTIPIINLTHFLLLYIQHGVIQ